MNGCVYVLIASGAAIVIMFLLIILPRIVIRRLPPAMVSGVPDLKDRLSLENDRLKLRNEFRTTCVSFVGGLALIAGVLITFQQVRSSQQALAGSLEVAQLVARNQQYVDSVKNLADPNPTVRVAAVEVIDDIAQVGTTQRLEATQILQSHVQQRSPWPPPTGDPYPANADTSSMPPLNARHPDVALALLRLGQGSLVQSKDLALYEVDLRGANLTDAVYSGRNFSGAHLRSSILLRIDLRGAALVNNSDLSSSDLTDAKLCGAWLGTADLTGATLRGAIADNQTTWPAGFNYAAAGVKNATGQDSDLLK